MVSFCLGKSRKGIEGHFKNVNCFTFLKTPATKEEPSIDPAHGGGA
jgi:hypothetical protein